MTEKKTNELLKEVIKELELTRKCQQQLIDTISKIEGEKATYIQAIGNEVNETRKQIRTIQDCVNEERAHTRMENSAFRFRRENIKSWKRLLNARKMTFYHIMADNDKTGVYEEFLSSENVFIPRKCRQRATEHEPEESLQRKVNVGIAKMENAILQLREQARKQDSKLKYAEEKIQELISTEESEQIQTILANIWRDDCKGEEHKSITMWQKKRDWLTSLPKRDNITDYLIKKPRRTVKQKTQTSQTHDRTLREENVKQHSFSDVVKQTPENPKPHTITSNRSTRSISVCNQGFFKISRKRWMFCAVSLSFGLFIIGSKLHVIVSSRPNNVAVSLTKQTKSFPTTTTSAWKGNFSTGQSWIESCDKKSAPPRPLEVHHMKSRNLMYCSLPKVGCTFWKRIFRFVNGDMKRLGISNPFEMKKEDVHLNEGIKFNPSSKSYRFMFVREPFSRLWSGYVDKIFLPNYWTFLGEDIVRSTRNLPFNAPTCGSDVSFEELLRYISIKEHHLESHFVPMSTLCNPCSFKPNFVGKMETFRTDSKFIARKFNLTSVFQSFKGRSIQEMTDQIRASFENIQKQHITCISKFELTQKLWKGFQYVGHIPRSLPFPKKKVEDLDSITYTVVTSLFLRELEQTKFSKEERRQQKEKYLREELHKIPHNLLLNILSIYQKDFEMFSYNKSYYLS